LYNLLAFRVEAVATRLALWRSLPPARLAIAV
jgi:hypothetical protein